MARQEPDRLQHAWQVHTAVQSWTNQAETKATFLLTIESALLVFFGTRFGDPDLLDGLTDFETNIASLLILLGLICLFGGIVSLVEVVYPRLREKDMEKEKWNNAIYFGHLAGQDPKAIENTLRRRDPLEQLARQLRAMGDIALTKHRALKASIQVAGFGVTLILVTLLGAAFLSTI